MNQGDHKQVDVSWWDTCTFTDTSVLLSHIVRHVGIRFLEGTTQCSLLGYSAPQKTTYTMVQSCSSMHIWLHGHNADNQTFNNFTNCDNVWTVNFTNIKLSFAADCLVLFHCSIILSSAPHNTIINTCEQRGYHSNNLPRYSHRCQQCTARDMGHLASYWASLQSVELLILLENTV